MAASSNVRARRSACVSDNGAAVAVVTSAPVFSCLFGTIVAPGLSSSRKHTRTRTHTRTAVVDCRSGCDDSFKSVRGRFEVR